MKLFNLDELRNALYLENGTPREKLEHFYGRLPKGLTELEICDLLNEEILECVRIIGEEDEEKLEQQIRAIENEK